MNTIINTETSSIDVIADPNILINNITPSESIITIINTETSSIDVIADPNILINNITPSESIITIINTETYNIDVVADPNIVINNITPSESIITIINTETYNIDVVADPSIVINNITPSESIITIIDTPISQITYSDIGVQGIRGAKGDTGIGLNYTWSATSLGIKREDEDVFVYSNLKGDTGNNLTFELLTETQKQELRGDVGNTSTNYTNIFYASLL